MRETSHIVKSYDQDLRHLNEDISKMASLAIIQLKDAITAVIQQNEELAREVIKRDLEIDHIEHEIEALAIRVIALRQPVARDLRTLITVLKVSNHLERIADYATNIAKRCTHLKALATVPSVEMLIQMADMGASMVQDVSLSYDNGDDVQALQVWHRDQELDEMYTRYLQELLTYMVADPGLISATTQLIFVAKNIERIGDHATNIAEMVYYLVKGTPFTVSRPKGDL